MNCFDANCHTIITRRIETRLNLKIMKYFIVKQPISNNILESYLLVIQICQLQKLSLENIIHFLNEKQLEELFHLLDGLVVTDVRQAEVKDGSPDGVVVTHVLNFPATFWGLSVSVSTQVLPLLHS